MRQGIDLSGDLFSDAEVGHPAAPRTAKGKPHELTQAQCWARRVPTVRSVPDKRRCTPGVGESHHIAQK